MSEFKKVSFGAKIAQEDITYCREILDRNGVKNVEDWLVFYGACGGIAWRYAVINNNQKSLEHGRIFYIDTDDDGNEDITEEKKSYVEVVSELKKRSRQSNLTMQKIHGISME